MDRRGGPQALIAGLALVACAACAPRLTPVEPDRGEASPAQALRQRAEDFCRARRGGELPPHSFTTDGCSLWPDGAWVNCCVEHDIAYWCGGSADQREQADETFRQCVSASSSASMGAFMVLGVRAGGFPWYPLPWRWGYGWDWPHGYEDSRGGAKPE